MTRYLPNRKQEFDLRAHVESSGHSIDTCPFVILTEKMCKGHLVKMGGKIKSWKKRWFVFDRLKRNFSYYVGEEDAPLFCSVRLSVRNTTYSQCKMDFVKASDLNFSLAPSSPAVDWQYPRFGVTVGHIEEHFHMRRETELDELLCSCPPP